MFNKVYYEFTRIFLEYKLISLICFHSTIVSNVRRKKTIVCGLDFESTLDWHTIFKLEFLDGNNLLLS